MTTGGWILGAGLTAAVLAAQRPLAPKCPSAVTSLGLDHVVVAVADLERASARYRELGFALKPGRFHDNGIQNQHVKFPDGIEIELLTAPQARDALTRDYRRHIAAGEGAVFLALFWPGTDLIERLSRLGLRPGIDGIASFPDGDRLRHILFGSRNSSPTDRPEHFAHPNGAETLSAVWLAGGDLSSELELLAALDAAACVDGPPTSALDRAAVVPLRDGHVYLLPESGQAAPGRRIAGATVRVRSLEVALETAGRVTGARVERSEWGRPSAIILPPAATHGIWLELREAGGEPAATSRGGVGSGEPVFEEGR